MNAVKIILIFTLSHAYIFVYSQAPQTLMRAGTTDELVTDHNPSPVAVQWQQENQAVPVDSKEFAALHQERVITGKVTDENGDPLPGVNVTIKGTTTGAITGIDGKYKITVSDDADVLVFTFTGYSSKEIEIGSQSVIDLSFQGDAFKKRYWCCGNHPAPEGPHCDPSKERLKKLGCRNFTRKDL